MSNLTRSFVGPVRARLLFQRGKLMLESPVYFKSLVTVLAVAGVLALVAVPLALRKVPPNRIYGFRTPATLQNEKIWYRANALFGRDMIIASACSVAAILILYFFLRPEPDSFLMISLLILAAPSMIAALLTGIRIQKMKGH